jgi:hypothetical protein
MRIEVNDQCGFQVNFVLSNIDIFSYAQDHAKMMTVLDWCVTTFSSDRFRCTGKVISFQNSNDLTVFLLKWGSFS